MKVKIITDSTSDFTVERGQELGIDIVPLGVVFGDETYVDGVTLKSEEFYKKLAESEHSPTTNQVNPASFEDAFKKWREQDYTIIGIFISSELSGTYQSAVIAKQTLQDDNIHLIDSRQVSFALALLVSIAVDRVNEGKSAQEIVDEIESIKDKVWLFGALETLENLKKGGRLTATKAAVAQMLNLKPIIQVKDGKVTIAGKSRGTKKAFSFMNKKFAEHTIDENYNMVFYGHGNKTEMLEKFKAGLGDVEEKGRIVIGPVVGTHAGPGCVGLAWVEK